MKETVMNFEFTVKGTAPGCGSRIFSTHANTESEALDYVREEASDFFGVRAEHVVLHVERVDANF